MGRRTLVVYDHPLTRAALVGLLEHHEFPVVGEASLGRAPTFPMSTTNTISAVVGFEETATERGHAPTWIRTLKV